METKTVSQNRTDRPLKLSDGIEPKMWSLRSTTVYVGGRHVPNINNAITEKICPTA